MVGKSRDSEELLAGLRSGDERSVEEILNYFRRSLRSRPGVSAADVDQLAEDCLGELFESVVKKEIADGVKLLKRAREVAFNRSEGSEELPGRVGSQDSRQTSTPNRSSPATGDTRKLSATRPPTL